MADGGEPGRADRRYTATLVRAPSRDARSRGSWGTRRQPVQRGHAARVIDADGEVLEVALRTTGKEVIQPKAHG